MDYIYGKLNKLVDAVASKIVTDDDSVTLSTQGSTTYIEINKHKLVELRRLHNRIPTQYQLFGYNTDTKQFDIPLGDKIIVSGGEASDEGVVITSAKIGNQFVDAYVDEAGQLNISSIPIAAITDTDYYYKPDGSIEYYESVIDGNA